MENSKTHIFDLPSDVIMYFALEMDIAEIMNLCLTSTRFNNIICKNKYFWKKYYASIANQWTPKKAEEARKDLGYIIIGPRLRGLLYLSGLVPRYQRTGEDLVYVPALRAVGERSFLKRYFTQVKDFPKEEIDRYLAEAFTIDNYQTTMKDRYDAENQYRQIKGRRYRRSTPGT